MNLTNPLNINSVAINPILELYNEDKNRYNHSLRVSELAKKIFLGSSYPNKSGEKIEEIIIAGLLHDVGYLYQFNKLNYHPIDGYNALLELGFHKSIALVAREHTFSSWLAKNGPSTVNMEYEKKVPKTIWEKVMIEIITLADCHVNHRGEIVTFEERLQGIIDRYPNYTNTKINLTKKHDDVTLLAERYNFSLTDIAIHK